METPYCCLSGWSLTWQTETSVTEFCYKSVNLFFDELVNIKGLLFLIHNLFTQIANFPEISHK